MSQKLEARVRNLQKLTQNKQCFDCLKTGLQSSVVFPFGIFVCTNCSGLHRQFPSHTVATITMANFTERQVSILESNGNESARQLWLANWTPSQFPRENVPLTTTRITDFIRQCFEEKRWKQREDGSGNNPQSQNRTGPTTLTINPNLSHGHDTSVQQTPMSTIRRPTQSYQPPASTRASDPFSSSQPQQPQQQQQQQVDLFDTSLASSPSPQVQGQPQVNMKPNFYQDITFPGAIPPSTLSSNAQEAMKAISKAMATAITQHKLTAEEFLLVTQTAGQVTASAWAQRENKSAGVVPTPTANTAVRPISTQQQQQQPQQRPPSSATPTTLNTNTTAIDAMFSNMSFDNATTQQPPKQQQPQPQSQQQKAPTNDIFSAMATQSAPQQQQTQQQPKASTFGGDWDFSQPAPSPRSQPAQPPPDDLFSDLVPRPVSSQQQPQQKQQQQQWGVNQPGFQQQPQQPQQMWGGNAMMSPQNYQQQQPMMMQQQQPMGYPQQQQPMGMMGGNMGYPQQQQPMGMMGSNMGYPQQQGMMGGNFGSMPNQGFQMQPQQQQQQQQQQPQQPTFDDIDLPF